MAYAAGCDFVKFQKRDIDLVYSREELDKPRESPWGTTTRQQKEGLEFGLEEHCEIDEYCKGKIKWFASPWDLKSIEFLDRFTLPFIKVPSALLTDKEYLEACREISNKIILSTGMSTPGQIDNAINVLGRDHIYCLMHCTSTYPTAPKEINIEYIPVLKRLYPELKIGFSNHYSGLMAMVMAITYGAEMVEFHITLDRTMYGSDQAASIEPQGVFKLMEYIRLIEQMRGDGIKRIYDSELPIIDKLRKKDEDIRSKSTEISGSRRIS